MNVIANGSDSVIFDELVDVTDVNHVHPKNIMNNSPSYALSNRSRRSLIRPMTRKSPGSRSKRSPLKGIKESNCCISLCTPEPAVRHAAKKRKITREQQNDTIIILSDDDNNEEHTNPRTPQCITQHLSTSRPTPRSVKNKTPKMKNKSFNKRKLSQLKRKRISKSRKPITFIDDDDVEVLWTSRGAVNNDSDNIHNNMEQSSIQNEEFFYIDTVGDAENLHAIESDPDIIIDDDNSKPPTKPVENNTVKTAKNSRKIRKQTQLTRVKSKQEPKKSQSEKLRQIVVDGCNVAMSHTNGCKFSVKGIELVIDYFQKRGHKVKVFIPRSKRVPELEKWYKDGVVVFTPSRKVGSARITPYDDRFILDYAMQCDGIVISSDQFVDLWKENEKWHPTIRNRVLPPTFVDDLVMFPNDPLGLRGPTLHEFLRH